MTTFLASVFAFVKEKAILIVMAAAIVVLFVLYRGKSRDLAVAKAKAVILSAQADRAKADAKRALDRADIASKNDDDYMRRIKESEETAKKRLDEIKKKEDAIIQDLRSKGHADVWNNGMLDENGGIKGFDE